MYNELGHRIKVLFVIPKTSFGTTCQPHTGIAYLTAMLRKHGIAVKMHAFVIMKMLESTATVFGLIIDKLSLDQLNGHDEFAT